MNQQEIAQELHALRQELHEAKQQMSATVAIEQPQPYKRVRWTSVPTFLKKKLFLLGAVAVLAVGISYGVKQVLYQQAVTKEASFVEQVKDLSQLATSQAYVKAVIEKEDNQLFGKEIETDLPGTKRKLLLIVPGTVTAGVDLAELDSSNLSINEAEKKMSITLPHATIIQDPSLDLDQAQTFSVEGLFRTEVNWDEAYELAGEAEALILQEAKNQGLLETAESNATKTLTEFFANLGWEAEITYE